MYVDLKKLKWDEEDGRQWSLPGLMYIEDLVLSEEDLKVIVGHFAEVCRRGLKVSANKSKAMVLGMRDWSARFM